MVFYTYRHDNPLSVSQSPSTCEFGRRRTSKGAISVKQFRASNGLPVHSLHSAPAVPVISPSRDKSSGRRPKNQKKKQKTEYRRQETEALNIE